jgi:hypothetical protein
MAKHQNIQPAFFDLKGLERFSGIPVSTARQYIKDAGLPCFRVRGKILISRHEFTDWLERYRVKSNLDSIVNEVMDRFETAQHADNHMD